MISLEQKIRTAAMADTTLQSYFGASGNTFRWFDTQLTQGAIKLGACARLLTVSRQPIYSFAGLQNVGWQRVQIDVLKQTDPVGCRDAASAIIDWLGTVSFGNIGTQYANFLLNQRGGMDYQLQPPAFVETLDVRIFNLEE